MNTMTQDDVVIIVSFSGQTENMREHIKMLSAPYSRVAVTAIGVIHVLAPVPCTTRRPHQHQRSASLPLVRVALWVVLDVVRR